MSKEGVKKNVLLGQQEDSGGNPQQFIPIRINAAGEIIIASEPLPQVLTLDSRLFPSGATQIVGAIGYGYSSNGASIHGLQVDDLTSDAKSSLGTDSDLRVLRVQANQINFNGATWDRQRGNLDFTILSSSSRTVETFSANFTNFNNKGIFIFLDITVIDVATTLQVTLQMKDPITGNYFDLQSGTLFDGVSSFITEIYPGIAEQTSATGDHFSRSIPRTFRIKITPSDANSVTYSVGGSLIL